MSGESSNPEAPEALPPVSGVEPSRPGSEKRVRERSESEKTLPPSAPEPAKRRALLLMEEEDRQSFDAVLTDADLEGERVTLPKADSPEPPPSSLSERENLTGQLLDGRYQIDYVLGVGSMGVVYGARHAAVGKLVAVKALRAHLASDVEAIQRFNAEATAATAIGNQHIVETFDFGRLSDGTAYLVMEYLEGRSLAEVIEGWAPLPLQRIVKIGLQLAEALNAAHLAGIVHRDLKPDNVFLCERDGEPDFVKILDFGIAKFGVSQARLTQAGAVFGTPAYMSPEQALGKETDGRTDVYALGVMLYEMACGKVPFEGENALSVLARHTTEEPEPLSKRIPDVSPELEAITHKCLHKDQTQRYETMGELAADLARLSSGMPVRAPVRSSSPSMPSLQDELITQPRNERPEPPPVLVVGRGVPWPLVMVLLVAVAAGVFWFSRHRGSSAASSVTHAAPNPAPPPLASTQEAEDGTAEIEVALVLFPLDAHVMLGDRDLGQMPVSVKVREGSSVKVRVVREGYWTRKLTLDGSKKRIVVGLVKQNEGKAPPADDEPPGSLPRAMPSAQ